VKRLLFAGIVLATPLIAPGAAAGGGGCHGDYVRDAKGVEVAMSAMCFDPLVVRIAKGQTVTWFNKDEMAHNLVGAGFTWGTEGRELVARDAISFQFNQAGTFPYACTIHYGMVGAVVVDDGVWAGPSEFGGVTQVATRLDADADPPAPTASSEPAVSAAAPEPTTEAVVAAPAGSSPPATGVQATQLSSNSSDRGPLVAAAIAIVGAMLVGAVIMLARRTPATRELVG
jgi:plastocyanin